MNYKALALGAMLGFVAALVPACGSKSCGPSNCSGCCDKSNNCVASNTNSACGKAGNACTDCTKLPATPACNAVIGTCQAGSTGGGSGGGGGTGGGTGGGSGGGTGGGAGTCSGCCSGTATPGTGGCSVGTCLTSGTTDTNCGTGGVACTNCAAMSMVCVAATHTCSGGTGGGDGGTTGALGSACSTAADCTNVAGTTPNATTNGGVQCKTQQLVGGATYPGGYCTRRCTSDANCGTAGFCVYGLGDTGEAENYCMASCGGAFGSCRTGYNCVTFGSGTGAPSGCLLGGADGGLYDPFDAGPAGAPGVQGGPCTMDNQCQPPDTGQCIPQTEADGGLSGFTGGACISDCTMNPTDAFCGDGASCVLFLFSAADGLGDIIGGLCYGSCEAEADGGQLTVYPDGGPTPVCRTGYHCNALGSTNTGPGYCVNDCNVAGGGCGSGYTCGSNGFCCNANGCY